MLVRAWNGVNVDIPWYRVDLIYRWAQGRIAYAREMHTLATVKRRWVAISPHGRVELGVCDFIDALTRASKLGSVSYTDMHYGFIFYNTDLGKNLPAQ